MPKKRPLGPVSLAPWLQAGQIDEVICGGENYDGARPCDFDWVKALREECVQRDITFCFMETGTRFIKDGREYRIGSKQLQNSQAFHSGMTYQGRPIHFELRDGAGRPVPAEDLYVPRFIEKCDACSFRILCNGCFLCGACEGGS